MGICDFFKRPKQNVEWPVAEERRPVIESSPEQIVHIEDATKFALTLSADFEGDGGFGNVVGNFDGQCLTCGALGWTWKFGDQQKMVQYCEKLYPGIVSKKMPGKGGEYLLLCSKPIAVSSTTVSTWSVGSKVSEPWRSELAALWGCAEMQGVQVYFAGDMAKKAAALSLDWVKSRNANHTEETTEVSMALFCFFFDLVVNNGSMKGVTYQMVHDRITQSGVEQSVEEVLHWCAVQSQKDCQRNAHYWEGMTKTGEQIEMMICGWLRALKSVPQWQASVMNRRGIIALGSGWAEGQLKKLPAMTQLVSLK